MVLFELLESAKNQLLATRQQLTLESFRSTHANKMPRLECSQAAFLNYYSHLSTLLRHGSCCVVSCYAMLCHAGGARQSEHHIIIIP